MSLSTTISVLAQSLDSHTSPSEFLEIPDGISTQSRKNNDKFTLFSVGINVGKQNVISSTLVRGYEHDSQAVSYDNWLVKFDDVIAALKLNKTYLDNGELELRSPGLVKRINPKDLTIDPELGLVFSIAEIQTILGVPTEFNLAEYAIQFNPPWLDIQSKRKPPEELPVILEGLPKVSPPPFTFAAVGQEVNITGRKTNSQSDINNADYQGELKAVGTLLGGSWYISTNQANLTNTRTWELSEAQYFRPTETADYVFGSQPTFWQSQNSGDYWGATTIQRWGFKPTLDIFTEEFNPQQRLQTNNIGRTISGQAQPGTLVQLTQGFAEEVIDEVLVDSSGIYRFENVNTSDRFGSNNYRVRLYPNGQLTSSPEIREANFSILPGQLSVGTSALIVSSGFGREYSDNNFFGNFTDWRGGIGYRRGVTEDLTLGAGVIYDQSLMGLAELFYQPGDFPLWVSASALLGTKDKGLEYNADIRFQPSPNFYLNFNSDQFSQKFWANWQAFPGISFRASTNSRDDSFSTGISIYRSQPHFSMFASADIDTQNNLRWNLASRWKKLQFTYRGNEISTNSQLSYNLSGKSLYYGHSLLLGHETRNYNNREDSLSSLTWRYRSQETFKYGNSIWEFDLGYGLGSQGQGIIVSTSSNSIPGLTLRLRYQEISAISDDTSFRIELFPRFNFQTGITPAEPRFERLRSRGGLLIQPFFDRNHNGKRDRGEAIYTKDANLLLLLNNQQISRFPTEINKNGIFVNLSPDIYRLDLDPAGYPIDWTAVKSAYAIEVVAGSYTPVLIPMTLSYTVAGVATNSAGDVTSGAKVEAIGSEKTIVSITNGAGIFYLEGLRQGSYKLMIDGKPAQPSTIEINQNSKPFEEIKLTGVDVKS
ncbi:MAG: carboxypeptidase-like regulatory domain-containing protein [Nostocales cyanobacterium 94392]|nr:carboxypeptidase-like regulatory domain-containing protein [Nostocales cyanobacterium 94392]